MDHLDVFTIQVPGPRIRTLGFTPQMLRYAPGQNPRGEESRCPIQCCSQKLHQIIFYPKKWTMKNQETKTIVSLFIEFYRSIYLLKSFPKGKLGS